MDRDADKVAAAVDCEVNVPARGADSDGARDTMPELEAQLLAAAEGLPAPVMLATRGVAELLLQPDAEAAATLREAGAVAPALPVLLPLPKQLPVDETDETPLAEPPPPLDSLALPDALRPPLKDGPTDSAAGVNVTEGQPVLLGDTRADLVAEGTAVPETLARGEKEARALPDPGRPPPPTPPLLPLPLPVALRGGEPEKEVEGLPVEEAERPPLRVALALAVTEALGLTPLLRLAQPEEDGGGVPVALPHGERMEEVLSCALRDAEGEGDPVGETVGAFESELRAEMEALPVGVSEAPPLGVATALKLGLAVFAAVAVAVVHAVREPSRGVALAQIVAVPLGASTELVPDGVEVGAPEPLRCALAAALELA